MDGRQYEQLVRAVLCEKLQLEPEALQSTHAPGVSFPGGGDVQHQVDLFFVQDTEVAQYLTIIECKYRGSRPVDQQVVQNLAFVRDNTRAHKAILVTNIGFTSGAKAVAESQKIALLVVDPGDNFEAPEDDDIDQLFDSIQSSLASRPAACDVQVICRLRSKPGGDAIDLVDRLMADPAIRSRAEQLLRDPGMRQRAREIARDNPDLARKAADFLKKRRW